MPGTLARSRAEFHDVVSQPAAFASITRRIEDLDGITAGPSATPRLHDFAERVDLSRTSLLDRPA
jgi:hypothetical protein